MRKSLELSLKLSEARGRLNGAIEKRSNTPGDPTAEVLAEMDGATQSLRALEIEYRAAVTDESAADELARRENPDSEWRERDRLLAGSSVMRFLDEAASGREVEGMEKGSPASGTRRPLSARTLAPGYA